jgi:hypothetical protein
MPATLVFAAQIKKLESFRHGLADSTALDEFDAETEQLILRTFGKRTQHLEAYGLATMGEAETIVNIPQSAQEDAVQDLPRKAIEQRRQVLEACMADIAAALEQPIAPQPPRAPAKKAKKATKFKPRAGKKMATKKKRPARGRAKKSTAAAKKKRAKRR